MKPSLLFILTGILWSLAVAPNIFAQAAAQDVEVQLSLADGKTVYRTGEPIRLVMSFTTSGDGYVLNTTTTKPASPVDQILVAPDSKVSHWLDEYSGSFRYAPDYMSLTGLSSTPSRVELAINDWVRFDQPGRYTVRVKTNRVMRQRDNRSSGAPVPLTTNEVSFEVKPMSEAEEAQEVSRLSSLLDVTRDLRGEEKLAEELSYLTGDVAAREKVRRFLNEEGRSGNYGQNIAIGLFISRNRALVLKLLEAALRDPEGQATYALMTTLTRLRRIEEEAAAPKAESSVDKRQMTPDGGDRRAIEIQQAYVRELAASLQKRTGKSRTTAAMTVLTLLPKDQAEAARLLKSVREILISEFDQLHPYSQEYLLRVYWEQLRDPSLATAIEHMLTRNNVPQGQQIRTAALKRLLELSPERARPYFIKEISDPSSVADFDVLSSLTDSALPEVDNALLEQIRKYAPIKQGFDRTLLHHKTLLAARYASPAVYDELMEIYKTWSSKWEPDARAALLSYFARYNEKQAMPLIEQALAELQPGQVLIFFIELTRANYSDGVDAILQKRLEGDEPEAVSTAAYIMAKRGPATARQLIEARLNRWLNQWRGRSAELDALPDGGLQKMVQVNLIEALLISKSWKLSDEQVKQLKQSCITDACRQHFPIR